MTLVIKYEIKKPVPEDKARYDPSDKTGVSHISIFNLVDCFWLLIAIKIITINVDKNEMLLNNLPRFSHNSLCYCSSLYCNI